MRSTIAGVRHARAVDADVREAVRVDARRVEPLELRPVGRERPPAVERNARDQIRERHVDPDRHAVEVDRRPVVGVGERAAAGGDDDVAHGLEEAEDLASRPIGSRLALAREDIGDGHALAPLDEIVDVLRTRQRSRAASARATVLLPLAMNPTR